MPAVAERPERAAEDYSKLEEAIAALGGPERFKAFWEALPKEEQDRIAWDWAWTARSKQLPPPGDWFAWHVRCGRGWGKTYCNAQFIRWRVEREGAMRIALVAATAADVRDVLVEGPSGLLNICPPWNRPHYEPSKRRLTWPNGAVATTFSADEPRALRGPEYDTFAADELAHWRFLDEAWSNLVLGTRRKTATGARPRGIITSTPLGLKFLLDLERDPSTVTTVGSTYENARNLAPTFLAKIADLEGTRRGRQEIHAEILTDNPGALWKQSQIDATRVNETPDLVSVYVGVDPAVTSNKDSDETGIIAAGKGWCSCRGQREMHAFVLDDASIRGTPSEWAVAAIATYKSTQADQILAEVNNGGELVELNIRVQDGGRNLPYRAIHASRGKQMRHAPVASLYEIGKVHHVGRFAELEEQMTQWDPTRDKSPDRIDALTIALTALMIEEEKAAPRIGVTVIG